MSDPTLELPANPNITPKRYSPFWFRFYEIIPGAIVWVFLLAPFILAFKLPLAVTIFIMLFDIYWLLRAVNYAVLLLRGYFIMQRNMSTDWQAKLNQLSEIDPQTREKLGILDWRDIYQVVIVPTYKEEQAILESSIDSIVDADYPKERMIVVLATEARDASNARVLAANLSLRYKDAFHLFLVTEHPDGIVGEVKAKGANATWAAKILKERLEAEHIPFENVIVSTADADTRFPALYFNCLSYQFAVTPDRSHASFQPVATFFNNIWQAPMLSRVLAFGTTFWQLIESIRSYRLITFSTHATCFKTLVHMDYWCVSVVNEDSRQFFRAYFRYNGNYRVIPLFIPIYMDAVFVSNPLSTLKNLYFQQQRWAYGVEHFPYIVLESARRKKIALYKRFTLVWRAFEGTFSWATASFFITIVGWLPLLLNPDYRGHIAASNFPIITKTLLSMTWIGLVVSSIICLAILPGRPPERKPIYVLTMFLQWIFVPISAIFFGAIPGIDSQTRLMLGKYLGFRVTEKKSVSS